ncbi:MAG: class I SAM-dependent methyltransferase [Allobaculum sp.]|nr:class I SAM-dependent methyltransferase [Allobaculum sp.]
MESITTLSHAFLKPALHSQALCLDATLGYGHDAGFFLAQNVHRVYAYELQPALAQETKKKLDSSRLCLFQKNHEAIGEDLAFLQGRLDAAIFNFGYDPKTKVMATQVNSSLKAVQATLSLLRPKGRLALVFYPHPQGQEEKETILKWLQDNPNVDVLCMAHPFKLNAPCLIGVEKMHAS